MDWVSLILMFLPVIIKLIESLLNRNPKRRIGGRDRKLLQRTLKHQYDQLQKAKPHMTPAQHAKYDAMIDRVEEGYDKAMGAPE